MIAKKLDNQLDKIHQLLESRQIQEAQVELCSVSIQSLNRDQEAYYYLLLAESKLWLGDLDIQELLERSLNYYLTSGENRLFARVKYLYGWYLTSIGDYLAAREMLLEAYLYFRRYEDLKNESLVLSRLSYVLYQTGAIDDAVRNLERCVEINEKLDRPDNVQTFSRNIAIVSIRSGALRKALSQLEFLRKTIERASESDRYQFYLIYAIALGLNGQIDEALEAISRTTRLSRKYKREKALYYEYLGWIYNLAGNYERAVKVLNDGLTLSMKIAPESALVSQIQRLLADAYLGQGVYDLAERTADDALAMAENIGEQAEIAACWRVFAIVEHKRGNRRRARQNYRKAMNLFQMIKASYELAETRLLAAESDMYDNGERAAMIFLAREYFQAEGLVEKARQANLKLSELHFPEKSSGSNRSGKAVFIAVDSQMSKIARMAENIARSNITVFLTGPTGCGKDQLALYIHEFSGRKGKFVTVNCAAIPDSIIESELFGHREGAFTGATRNRPGLFAEADGGTLYLNEIADATPEFQAKLLEVIETRTIRQLGGNALIPVDIRIIAATNHDLEKWMRSGRFRPDLFHRLNELPIALPRLNKRKDDIPELVRYFLARNNVHIDDDHDRDFDQLIKKIGQYNWPGNVRELKSEINRLCLMSKGDMAQMVRLALSEKISEREMLINALEETDWNRLKTSRILGIAESSVRYRIRKYGLIRKD
nr:sigma 54-interacting transcriptional regulator [candidate division Zixibacteria bacterium]